MGLLEYSFIQNALLASLLGGIGCSVIGVFIVTMEIPFLGVSMAHSAFAGALFGLVTGIDPFVMALLFCFISSLLIGPISDKSGFNPDTAIGILFSVMLGLGFLFLASFTGPKTEALSFIWGSILTVSRTDLALMGTVSLLIAGLVALFFKEIKAVIFNREVAASAGIAQKPIYYLILFACGAVISANLHTIGGLLIFSLVINPAAAAFQLSYSLRNMFLVSSIFGVVSCFIGLIFSYFYDLPAGAIIIIVSGIIFFLSLLASPKNKAGYGVDR